MSSTSSIHSRYSQARASASSYCHHHNEICRGCVCAEDLPLYSLDFFIYISWKLWFVPSTTMSCMIWVNDMILYNAKFVFACWYFTPSHWHHRHRGIVKIVRYMLSVMCLFPTLCQPDADLQYTELCVIKWTIYLLMIVRIFVFNLWSLNRKYGQFDIFFNVRSWNNGMRHMFAMFLYKGIKVRASWRL